MDECRDRLAGRGVIVTENVMPEFNVLDIEPARAAIREVFIDRIVHAKGIDRAQAMFDRVLMPTPAAVMEGARLLADGCDGRAGLGALLVVDPGGATTDVHSVASGEPTPGRGDSAGSAGAEGEAHGRGRPRHAPQHRRHRRSGGRRRHRRRKRPRRRRACGSCIAELARDVGRVPAMREEAALDRALARAAVRLAVKRHAGTVRDGVHRVRSGDRATRQGSVRRAAS